MWRTGDCIFEIGNAHALADLLTADLCIAPDYSSNTVVALIRLDFSNGIHYMDGGEFEWDDAKAEANLRKHKISFRAAGRVFDDPLVLIEQDLSEDYDEDRFLATGRVEGLLITVAFAERGDCIRIISARKANSNERRAYDQS